MTAAARVPSGRPQPGEYAAYAEADIARVAGEDAVAALERVAAETIALLAPCSEQAVAGLRPAPGKWTLKEVIGHLIDDERIFAYRALCVARRDGRSLAGFDQDAYVAATAFEQRPLSALLDEYRAVRAASIALFAGLTPEEWQRRGVVNGYEASVRGLAFHIAGHEHHHLLQLREHYVRRDC